MFLFSEVLVLFDYDGQAEDELTIRKGDVILDVRKIEGGWWEGVLGSKRGHFPDNFVMVILFTLISIIIKSIIYNLVDSKSSKICLSNLYFYSDNNTNVILYLVFLYFQ